MVVLLIILFLTGMAKYRMLTKI